jgi:protein-S-isoprenylcysteine O-methyltransferase Ste14
MAITRIYKSESLYTKGVYSFCRHPLYSSWIVFIVPGIMLLTNSWVLLTVPLFMYFLFRLLIEEEESYLLKKYGEEYKNYKNNVGLLFPKLKKHA